MKQNKTLDKVEPTSGKWECIGGESKSRYIHTIKNGSECGKLVAIAKGENLDETKSNALLIAAAPELFQMVRGLKDCIKRLSQDNVSQFDRDTEAQWEGEAHELLTRINPNYYKNANEKY